MYIGWGFGPRSCPGKKFSQVEFVAVVALLLKDWKIEPGREEGESIEEARTRLRDIVDDNYHSMGPRMRRPDQGRLVFVRR